MSVGKCPGFMSRGLMTGYDFYGRRGLEESRLKRNRLRYRVVVLSDTCHMWSCVYYDQSSQFGLLCEYMAWCKTSVQQITENINSHSFDIVVQWSQEDSYMCNCWCHRHMTLHSDTEILHNHWYLSGRYTMNIRTDERCIRKCQSQDIDFNCQCSRNCRIHILTK